MIEPKTYYEVICDNCGEELLLDEVSAWRDYEDAEEAITYCNWKLQEDGKCYCNECLNMIDS